MSIIQINPGTIILDYNHTGGYCREYRNDLSSSYKSRIEYFANFRIYFQVLFKTKVNLCITEPDLKLSEQRNQMGLSISSYALSR